MNIFKYFYYILYKYNSNNGRTDPWQSIGIVWFFSILNFHTFCAILEVFFKIYFFSKSLTLIGSLLILFIMYNSFVSKKNLSDLEVELRLKEKKLLYLNIILFLYIIASIFFVIVLLNMAREQNLKSQFQLIFQSTRQKSDVQIRDFKLFVIRCRFDYECQLNSNSWCWHSCFRGTRDI